MLSCVPDIPTIAEEPGAFVSLVHESSALVFHDGQTRRFVVSDMWRFGERCGDSVALLTFIDDLKAQAARCPCDEAFRKQQNSVAFLAPSHLSYLQVWQFGLLGMMCV